MVKVSNGVDEIETKKTKVKMILRRILLENKTNVGRST